MLPMFIYVKTHYCGGSVLATWIALLVTLLPALHFTVLPMTFRPYGDDK